MLIIFLASEVINKILHSMVWLDGDGPPSKVCLGAEKNLTM